MGKNHKTFSVGLFLLAWICAAPFSASARNTHGLQSQDEEMQARFADASNQGYATSGCLHGTSGTTAVALGSCMGYAKTAATTRLEYFAETTSRTITYSGGDGTYWLIAHSQVGAAVGGWTRVDGTHYLWQLSSSKPTTPASAIFLSKSTVSAGAITLVADWRPSSMTGMRSVTDSLYGADPTGVSASADAFGTALAAAEDQGGDIVYVPRGIYLLGARIRVGHNSTLSCARAGAFLRATAASIQEMVVLQGKDAGVVTVGRSMGIEGCILDGATLVAYGVGIDAANGFRIVDNIFANFDNASIRTSFSRDGNADLGEINNNHTVSAGTALNMGMTASQDTPAFFQTMTANGSILDTTYIHQNRHGSPRTGYCITLDTAARITVRDFWCGNNAAGEVWAGGVQIKNTGDAAMGTINASNIIIENVVLENNNGYATPIGVDIDCTYSGAGTTGSIRNTRVYNVRTGQTGTTDNILARVRNTGSNCEIDWTMIFEPNQQMDTSNLSIVIGDAGDAVDLRFVNDTRIYYQDTNNRLDTIITDYGVRTSVNALTVDTANVPGSNITGTNVGRGMLTYSAPDKRFWTNDHTGTSRYIAGGAMEHLSVWLSSSTQFAQLGRLVPDAYYVRAEIHTTEAWNSSGTDEIRCGAGSAGSVTTVLFTLTDVAATGFDTPTLGARRGYDASGQTYNCEYVNGGTEPSTGKSLVTIEFYRGPTSP